MPLCDSTDGNSKMEPNFIENDNPKDIIKTFTEDL